MVYDVRLLLPGESTVEGATIVGNVVIATGSTVNYNIGNWVGGVDDTSGYVVIGNIETAGLAGRPTGGGTGVAPSVGPTFWRSKSLTIESLTELANKLPGTPGNLTTLDAKDWILAAGGGQKYIITNDFSTGGGSMVGDYSLSLAYAPAPIDGTITFPAHPIGGGGPGFANDDPNLVGTEDGTYAYQLYINTNDSTGTSQISTLEKLVGGSGQITLTQNMDYVTYSFTADAFKTGGYGGNVIYYDSEYGSPTSPLGSLTVIHGSEAPFNVYDPITITISLN